MDLIGSYKIRRRGTEPLILNSVTTIDPINRWFEVTHYSDNNAMTIVNLVETTWMVQYPWTVEIIYYQGGEFLGHEFKSILIENEYGINT